MVSRVNAEKGSAKAGGRRARVVRRLIFEIAVASAIIAIFFLKVLNYADPEALLSSTIGHTVALAFDNTISAVENIPFLNQCPSELSMADIPGGFVCAQGAPHGAYEAIYTSYPLVGQGRESIYASTDEGSVAAANDLLHNRFDLPRYAPVQFASLPTWSENPYRAQYWRFEFYSLRPSLNLLYAFRTTGRAGYARQLLRLDLSFIAAEPTSRWAWADPHAAAFRCMALVDTWWKLRQGHQLPEAASTAILTELEKTGQFLADPNHYQPGENHGTNEAAALYGLAVAFPGLPHAQQWLAVAEERFQWQLDGIIDADGQLIENSPYYDFYTLEKYWQIYNYSLAQGYPISPNFGAKLKSMINFATYILQPNSQLPLMGASLQETINDHGVYAQMAATDPEFQYVLTHGARGSAPPAESIYFPASALTVMRSGWGAGPAYARSTYLTYYVGRYRTAHSDLDALGITLYGDGGDLLTDPGLYTYTPGAYHDYFHGTLSHNTVAVDGSSQVQGDGTAEGLLTRDGVTYQSAENSLYTGVTHRRMVMMIDPDHVLVVDRLSSAATHTYQQMFHLFPGARLAKDGLTVTGTGGTPQREITIQQLLPGSITESDTINRRGSKPDGLCSVKYGHLLPCYSIQYADKGKDATFVTLLTIGSRRQAGFSVNVGAGGRRLGIVDGQRHLSVSLGESTAVAPTARATDPTPPAVPAIAVPVAAPSAGWSATGNGSVSFGRAGGGSRRAAVTLSAGSGSAASMQSNAVRLNLQQHDARLTLRVTGLAQVTQLQLRLSNDHWAKSVTTSLLDTYTSQDAGQWVSLFVGRGGPGSLPGEWQASAPGFNWAKIDGMEIELVTRTGGPATVSLDQLAATPEQKAGKVVFIFDDGLQSILPAASYLHKNGMAGNIAVIGKYVDYPVIGYLNLFQLQSLQDNWGWNMVNETQRDVNAVQQYYDRPDISGYTRDIVQQATWLEANRLNSAPNWFIYPYGKTNSELERVVGRFYMFARVTADGPDAYPYGDPREITDLEVRSPGPGKGKSSGFTTPAEIASAVHQAVVHHTTLILTFQGIHSESDEPPGYPIALFEKVVDDVRASGAQVMTLSQLDRSNGVPVTNRIDASPGQPSQITVQVSG